ncbi:epoxyqueuosine reductase QueH [Anaerostipes sp.]|uniref:epoxyqueuosine reductase QueH n=1 Tax=Anaerostipes sp. TaxID=1872530 RepID=UPI0025C0599B|nr:epoxyqueuosine reductase QueH [Anaerostipes sp.]MBS7007930.1 epoxyqueuosine reductase QueH [Anaerostipes sp.]
MMKENYQKKLDCIIEGLQDQRPSLLLHSCCAPCSSYVLEYLSKYFQITVYYFNPNIDSKEEYEKRAREQERLISEMGLSNQVSFIKETFRPEEFYQAVKGYEKEPEGGKRCLKCYRLRLTEAARKAKELESDYFTTTLTISPLKNAQWLNEIGQESEEQYQVKFLPSDFKKKNGYKRSVELSQKFGLYRQSFCGCIFSKNEN